MTDSVSWSKVGLANFCNQVDVSRETLHRLESYATLLEKWNRSINLVGDSTLSDIWTRHFLDSAQLSKYVATGKQTTTIQGMDIGTGAGFPGLVLAIMGVGHMHLVESDRRKCSFLQQVAHATEAPVTIYRNRVEDMPRLKVDFVCARACAPVARLLQWASPHSTSDTEYWFLKGKSVHDELTQALTWWKLKNEQFPSLTSDEGVVLHLRSVSPINQKAP